MRPHSRLRPALLAAASAVLVATAPPSPLAATQGSPFLPAGELPRLFLAPREPHMGIELIALGRSASAFGEGIEWEASFGHGIPFFRFWGDAPDQSLFMGIHAGVFGRFAFQTTKRDLISSDWLFAVPVYLVRGQHWIRLRYRHISSHLGDDYIARFEVDPEGYLRDAVGLLGYWQASPAVGLYGGGNYAFNVDPNVNRRLALEGGTEIYTRNAYPTPFYGGVDVYVDQDSSFRPRVNTHVGASIVDEGHRGIRFIMELLVGPSPQGEFRRGDVTLIAIGLVVEI